VIGCDNLENNILSSDVILLMIEDFKRACIDRSQFGSARLIEVQKREVARLKFLPKGFKTLARDNDLRAVLEGEIFDEF
jgi:hypothetical protein